MSLKDTYGPTSSQTPENEKARAITRCKEIVMLKEMQGMYWMVVVPEDVGWCRWAGR